MKLDSKQQLSDPKYPPNHKKRSAVGPQFAKPICNMMIILHLKV